MGLLINVALLTFGFVGTLSAFGGETWRSTDEPLRKRITKRGWLSLGCLILALSLGVTKEVQNNRASGEEARKRLVLEQQLGDTRQRLEAANEALQNISKNVRPIPRLVNSEGLHIPPGDKSPLRRAVFGGDKIEYFGDCRGLVLNVGSRSYPLNTASGVLLVEGTLGQPMEAAIGNPTGRACHMKMNVYSVEPGTP